MHPRSLPQYPYLLHDHLAFVLVAAPHAGEGIIHEVLTNGEMTEK